MARDRGKITRAEIMTPCRDAVRLDRRLRRSTVQADAALRGDSSRIHSASIHWRHLIPADGQVIGRVSKARLGVRRTHQELDEQIGNCRDGLPGDHFVTMGAQRRKAYQAGSWSQSIGFRV
jgi:hypothetical protein